MPWYYSVRKQLILALSLAVLGTVAAWWLCTSRQFIWWHWLACWMPTINLLTFIYYGLDKYLAQRKFARIPERVLHTLCLIGGSPAALLAMNYFRHKTIKSSFRILYWSIVVLQIALTAYIVKLMWWN